MRTPKIFNWIILNVFSILKFIKNNRDKITENEIPGKIKVTYFEGLVTVPLLYLQGQTPINRCKYSVA